MSSDEWCDSWQKKVERNCDDIITRFIQNVPIQPNFVSNPTEWIPTPQMCEPFEIHNQGAVTHEQDNRNVNLESISMSLHNSDNSQKTAQGFSDSQQLYDESIRQRFDNQLQRDDAIFQNQTCYQHVNNFPTDPANSCKPNYADSNCHNTQINWRVEENCGRQRLNTTPDKQPNTLLNHCLAGNFNEKSQMSLPRSESLKSDSEAANSNFADSLKYQALNERQSMNLSRLSAEHRAAFRGFDKFKYSEGRQKKVKSPMKKMGNERVDCRPKLSQADKKCSSLRKDCKTELKKASVPNQAPTLKKMYENQMCSALDNERYLKYSDTQKQAANILELAHKPTECCKRASITRSKNADRLSATSEKKSFKSKSDFLETQRKKQHSKSPNVSHRQEYLQKISGSESHNNKKHQGKPKGNVATFHNKGLNKKDDYAKSEENSESSDGNKVVSKSMNQPKSMIQANEPLEKVDAKTNKNLPKEFTGPKTETKNTAFQNFEPDKVGETNSPELTGSKTETRKFDGNNQKLPTSEAEPVHLSEQAFKSVSKENTVAPQTKAEILDKNEQNPYTYQYGLTDQIEDDSKVNNNQFGKLRSSSEEQMQTVPTHDIEPVVLSENMSKDLGNENPKAPQTTAEVLAKNQLNTFTEHYPETDQKKDNSKIDNTQSAKPDAKSAENIKRVPTNEVELGHLFKDLSNENTMALRNTDKYSANDQQSASVNYNPGNDKKKKSSASVELKTKTSSKDSVLSEAYKEAIIQEQNIFDEGQRNNSKTKRLLSVEKVSTDPQDSTKNDVLENETKSNHKMQPTLAPSAVKTPSQQIGQTNQITGEDSRFLPRTTEASNANGEDERISASNAAKVSVESISSNNLEKVKSGKEQIAEGQSSQLKSTAKKSLSKTQSEAHSIKNIQSLQQTLPVSSASNKRKSSVTPAIRKTSTSQETKVKNQKSASSKVHFATEQHSDTSSNKNNMQTKKLQALKSRSSELPLTSKRSQPIAGKTKSSPLALHKTPEKRTSTEKKNSDRTPNQPGSNTSAGYEEEQEEEIDFKESGWSNSDQYKPVVPTHKGSVQDTKSIDQSKSSNQQPGKTQSHADWKDPAKKRASSSAAVNSRTRSIASRKSDVQNSVQESKTEIQKAKKSSTSEADTMQVDKRPAAIQEVKISQRINDSKHLLQQQPIESGSEKVADIETALNMPITQEMLQKSKVEIDKTKLTPTNKQEVDPMSDAETFESAESYLSDRYGDAMPEPLPED